MTEHVFRLRQTWADTPHIFHVVDEAGDTVARISHDNHVPSHTSKWQWHLTYHRNRHMPSFAGRCDSLEACKAEIRARYEDFMAALEFDGHLEQIRREKRGVPTVMFFYDEEYEQAPQHIEDLAGCLEDTVEDAWLSLLVDSVALWEQRLAQDPNFSRLRRRPSLRGTSSPASDCFAAKEATMADDLMQRGQQDRSRINLSEDYEIRYWAQKFGVTRDDLERAVRKVGSSAAAVAKELGKEL